MIGSEEVKTYCYAFNLSKLKRVRCSRAGPAMPNRRVVFAEDFIIPRDGEMADTSQPDPLTMTQPHKHQDWIDDQNN